MATTLCKDESDFKYRRILENHNNCTQYNKMYCYQFLPAVMMMMVISFLLFILIVLYALVAIPRLQGNIHTKQIEISARPVSSVNGDASKVLSCYYNFPSEDSDHELMPSDIHPYLCTHINVAFARVVNKQISLEHHEYTRLQEVVKLKHSNPELKVLLSVGGAGNDNGFSEMVINHASRKIFIKSIKNLLRNYTLDGIDLDWEFPALHGVQSSGRERQHFSQLLREVRMEFIREKRDYILTIAAAAPQIIVDVSYDIDQLNQYVDFVNVMTYDYHYYTKYTPFTGLNSPLYPRASEQLYLATLNINYTVHMYLSKGLDPSKIVVGIPTYGHSFTLVNKNNHGVGSPASGFGSLGALGFVSYPQVCTFIANFSSDTTVQQDSEAKVSYLYNYKEWVSFETPQSVMEKAQFIKQNNLRGGMIYSLNADDFEGICEHGDGHSSKFTLSLSVRNTLMRFNIQK